ncbi:unnamed protein product, partial [Protopolystoma xenopodis]
MSRFSHLAPWFILSSAALNVIFLGGKRRAFGVFVAQLRDEFNATSLAELNWIGDSYAAIGYLTTTLSTSLILKLGRRYGLFQFAGACFVLFACVSSAYVPNPHWLFLTHTVLHGIGSSLILSTAGLVVNEHFDKSHRYHILATTLVSGGSVASIVFVQFYAFLVESYGWRHAMIILGVVYFFVIASASLVFRKSVQTTGVSEGRLVHSWREHLVGRQIPLLVLWTVDRIITSIVTYGMLLNLTDFMHRIEPSLTKSAVLTTLFASGEASTYLLGAMTTGLTKNLLKNRLKYILIVTTLLMSASLAAWEAWASNLLMSHILAYICGFCLGPSITFLFPAGEEMTRLPGHLAYPFSLGGMGLGMSLSPLLSALIAQIFLYKWFFLVQAGLMAIKLICLLVATFILHTFDRANFILPTQVSPEHVGYHRASGISGEHRENPLISSGTDVCDAGIKASKPTQLPFNLKYSFFSGCTGKLRWSANAGRLMSDDVEK